MLDIFRFTDEQFFSFISKFICSPGEKYFAMKYIGAFYGNVKFGKSNFLGLFTVFNAQTGEVEAIIDDKGYLTDCRTGVAGSIATSINVVYGCIAFLYWY